MKTEIKVPSVGESITSGILTSWVKQNGETVKEGETICELETEKTTLEIPSPASGVLTISVQADSEVEIGQVIGTISDEGQAPAAEEKPQAESEPKPESEPQPQPQPKQEQPKEQPKPQAQKTPEPAVEKPASVPEPVKPQVAPEQRNVTRPSPPPQQTQAPPRKAPPAAPPPMDAYAAAQRRTERVPMTGIRKKTADRLVRAQQTAAYLTTFNEIDMQKVVEIRSQYKDQFEKEHGIRIGYMSFFVKACCRALKEYPGVNAQMEGDEIVYQYFYDIGVAISTETGLIVPVIRDADRLNFADIEAAIVDLAKRANSKRINPDELTGGTFTITNGGVFGSMLSTPIPAYPQTAILGMHAIKKRPVVVDDQVVIRPVMYVALSYDHRVIDGKQAIGFLATVKNYIEEPDKLLLEL